MLEALANEVLLELFEFLDAVELFRAFYDLNNRCNTLLLTHFRAYRINFHSVLKYRPDKLLTQYLPSIINRTISLRLSDNSDESSPQTVFFFSSGLQLNQFIHLRSLSLCYIDCEITLRNLMIYCHQLLQLTHLTIIKCYVEPMTATEYFNIIWNLTQLTHCRLDVPFHFSTSTKISSTLEHLSISCELLELSNIFDLFQRTPNLRYLCAPLNKVNDSYHDKLPSIPSMTMLKLTHIRSLIAMVTILQAMPNLTYLKIDTHFIDCDGYQWEQLINDYLPKLKVFHLRTQNFFDNEKQIEQLVDSFRTRFWLDKHQWFVRCHHRPEGNFKFILLYTVPYAFVDMHSHMLIQSYKTTYPSDNNNNNNLYDRVKNLVHTSHSSLDYLSFIRFSHIRNLSIDLRFDKNLWKNVPVFSQLTSITVSSTDEHASFHLQSLLDRSPCLYSLKIQSWPFCKLPSMKNIPASLRRLDLRVPSPTIYSIYSDIEQCDFYIHSPLAMQCEELLINVQYCETIANLVNEMHQLRILKVQYRCLPPSFVYDVPNEIENEMVINWLKTRLPSTCIISTFNDNNFELWIYLEKP